MGELAARARLAKQTMTTLVRLAERDGLVRRERDVSDRRAFRIFLTARSIASSRSRNASSPVSRPGSNGACRRPSARS